MEIICWHIKWILFMIDTYTPDDKAEGREGAVCDQNCSQNYSYHHGTVIWHSSARAPLLIQLSASAH